MFLSRTRLSPVSIRIDAIFASEIQRYVAMGLLNDFLRAWKAAQARARRI
jgi:hypothetical protein